MAENDILEDELEEGAPQSTKRGQRSGLILSILKWMVIFIAATAFIVGVVLITMYIMGSGQNVARNLPVVSEIDEGIPDVLDWYELLGEIRGSTTDEPRKSYIIEPYIGYEQGAEIVLQEIISRAPQIKERIRLYFTSSSASELEGIDNQIRIKNELREQINRIMRNKIREVAFNQYQVLDF